ncbi:NAD+ synthase [Candidatus Micrarchaeota archaeon]|nr:NAD+ synthase [Candidatus Micrarchaeota archaeon]MBU1939259.1 NAD+ synthase [Candidatus Micrarchaeota archaeon]
MGDAEDAGVISKNIVSGIRTFFENAGRARAVLGLSGGVDSAVCASLLAEALGAENVTALAMPYSHANSPDSETIAVSFAKSLGIKCFVCPLKWIMEPLQDLPWEQDKLAQANSVARARALLLYNYANSNNALVAGTGNRSEIELGYFTKYGDAAADLLVIGALWKTRVFELARARGIPDKIIERPPSAELWEGQTDADELGADYGTLDAILSSRERGKAELEKAKQEFGAELVESILDRRGVTAHKRRMPKVIDV